MAIPLHDEAEEAQPMVEINTTPLVDVLLVLLVMLIITIPVQLHSVNLEMPGLSAPAPPLEPQVVRIDVTATGQLIWNGEVLTGREALDARLRDAAAQPVQPEIHLRPQRTARYDVVAGALASAQRAGLSRIGLVGAEQFAR